MRRTYFYEEDIVESQEAHRRVLLGWAADVHLAPDAYRDLAAVALEAGVKVESDGAGSIVSEDSKRKRRESVVTRLPAMVAKRNKGHASQQ